MKKIVNVLTVLVAGFIFMFFYQKISLNHYNSVNGLESSFPEATGKHHITIEYNLYDDEDNNVFHKLVDFLEENKYDAISIEQDTRYDFIIDTTIYLYTEKKLNELEFFKSMNGKEIDFTSNANNYYSSFIDDEGATDVIDFINNSYHKEYQPKLTIKQFQALTTDHKEKRTAVIYIYGEDNDRLIDDIENSEIANYIVSDDSFFYHLAGPEVLNTDGINILLILSIASLIVIAICDLIGEKKEITIRKLFGERNFGLYYDLIAKRYLFNLILYFATQVLLYMVIIRDLRPVHLLLLRPLLLSLGLYIAFWIFANMVSYFILTKVGKATNLKQNSTGKITNSITLIIKVVLIILVITPFLDLFTSAPLLIEENIILRKNKTNMLNNLVIDGVDSDTVQDTLEEPLSFFEGLNWIYRDFSSNYLPEEIIQSIPEEEFKDQFVQHPYIVANFNYLKDYDIKSLDGNPIDYNALEHNTLLVPEAYKDHLFTDIYYYHEADNHILYIQDTGTFYNYYPLVPNLELLRQENPVILYIDRLDSNSQWAYHTLAVRNEEGTQKKINEFLSNNNLENVIYMANTDNVYNTAVSRSNDQVFNLIMTLCLYILMIIIFQYQAVFVYFSENKDEIAVNYLFGKTYLQRYGYLIFNSIIVYSVPLLIGIRILGVRYTFMLFYILFGIILDIIVSTVMIRSFEKKKTLSVLKGE